MERLRPGAASDSSFLGTCLPAAASHLIELCPDAARRQLDMTDEAVRLEAPLDARLGQAALDQARAHAAAGRSYQGRAAFLAPAQRQSLALGAVLDGPGEHHQA